MTRPDDVLLRNYPALRDSVARVQAKQGLLKTVVDANSSIAPLRNHLTGLHATLDVSAAISSQFKVAEREIARQVVASTNAHAVLRGVSGVEDHKALVSSITALFAQELQLSKVANDLLEGLRQNASGVARFVDDQRRLDEQIDEFVLNHSWPLPLHIGARSFRAIVSLASSGKRAVSQRMREVFAPGTRPFRSSFDVLLSSPHFSMRRPLLEQSVRAYRRREWYLVVNSLLPLVEGVLFDSAYGEMDTRPARGGPDRALPRIGGDDQIGLDVARRSMETLILGGGANVAIFDSYDPNLYGRAGEPQVLNRHAILHGAARRYGTEENALKLLLLLTMMAESLGYEAT